MIWVTDICELRGGGVEIWADGTAFLRVRAADFRRFPLSVGQAVDEAEYIRRLAQAQYPAAYEAALCLLDRSARTCAEIRRALLRKGYVDPVADRVIEALRAARLIDDTRIAERMAEKGAQVGLFTLKRKLRARGIDESEIDEALSEIPEETQRQAALSIAQKYYPKYAALPSGARRAKVVQVLARRGFSWTIAQSVVEQLDVSPEWE